MARCESCGGELGRDCFNVGECAAITADMMRGPNHSDVLNYVADMTFCGKDGEWHFKPGYDPQRVLDAIQQS